MVPKFILASLLLLLLLPPPPLYTTHAASMYTYTVKQSPTIMLRTLLRRRLLLGRSGSTSLTASPSSAAPASVFRHRPPSHTSSTLGLSMVLHPQRTSFESSFSATFATFNESLPHEDSPSTNHHKKKKRARDPPRAFKEAPSPASVEELKQHHHPPAIDNSGILQEGEEEHRPPTFAVRGAQMKGGNVVWRASGDEDKQAKATQWEKVNAEENLRNAFKESKTGPFDPNFKALGVIEPDKDLDLQLMISNYTVPALATGLRDREETLQLCAHLLANGDLEQLERVLHPYQAGLITRRRRKTRSLDLAGGLTSKHLNMLRKYLQRSPRQLTRAVSLRASVVIPLCNVNGVASVLFERRSSLVRSFKNQVCFPGGMVEESLDVNIIETSLREMEEEIGFPAKSVDVLGVLRCDWSEVHKITGIGVTPVVGFLGDLTERELSPNPDEVAECFTIPLATLLDEEHWSYEEEKGTVVFVGGPHVIWGLTAHLLLIFMKDILKRYKIHV